VKRLLAFLVPVLLLAAPGTAYAASPSASFEVTGTPSGYQIVVNYRDFGPTDYLVARFTVDGGVGDMFTIMPIPYGMPSSGSVVESWDLTGTAVTIEYAINPEPWDASFVRVPPAYAPWLWNVQPQTATIYPHPTATLPATDTIPDIAPGADANRPYLFLICAGLPLLAFALIADHLGYGKGKR
jgi:hypothetical protein